MMLLFLFTITISLEDLGDYYFNKNEYKKALKIYKMTKDTAFNKKIGLCYYKLEDYDNANKYGIPSFFYINKGIEALNEGYFELALKYFSYANYNYGIGYANYKLGKIDVAKEFFLNDSNFFSLGVIYYNEGKYDSAINYFIKSNNNKEIGFCLYMMGKYDEAIKYLGDEPLYLGECYYMLKNYSEAIKYYREAPDNKYSLYGIAFSYYRLKEFDKAAEEFLAFINKYGEDAKILYYLARAYQRGGKVKNSIYYFNKFINNYSEDELIDEAYYWLGKAYFYIGDYTNCKDVLTTLIEKYTGSELISYAYLIIGDIHYNKKEYNIAIDYYNKVEKPTWLVDNARLKIEQCYLRLGEYKSEEEVFTNFINKYPEAPITPKIGIELAQHLTKKLKLNEAIKVYNKIIKECSWSPYVKDAKFNLADVYFRLGKYDSAIAIYKTLPEKEAQLYIADIYFDIKEYDKAIEEYKKLLITEYESEALYKIGLSYLKSDKTEEARLYFNEFIEKNNPTSDMYWEVYLNLAKTYLTEGNIDDYIKTLMFIRENSKGDVIAVVNFLLGDIYYDKEEYEKAKKFYIEAASIYKDNDAKAEAFIKAANCAKLLNLTQEAIELYKKVITINPIFEPQVRGEIEKLDTVKVFENK